MILRLASALALVLTAAAPAWSQSAGVSAGSAPAGAAAPNPLLARASAELRGPDGKRLGVVELGQRASGVVIHGELQGLPPGWLALHVHAVGACSPDFSAAGGHFNPTDAQHGIGAGGPHAGDLPNIWVHQDGQARFEMLTDRFALTENARATDPGAAAANVPTLFDQDGAAIVIHAQPDDYVSQPSGAAGDRIACGVIGRG